MKKKLIAVLGCAALLLALSAPALAAPEDGVYEYILDSAGLLYEEQLDSLEEKAASIADTYGFAPYIITIDELNGYDVTDLALSFYDEYALGAGENHEGAILLLSMEDRDYAFEVRDYTNAVFDDYRVDSVEQAFLEDFRYDDWYGGFCDYLDACEHYLSGAADDVEEGEDYNYYGDYTPNYGAYEEEEESGVSLLIVVVIPLAVAALVCLIMLGMMKSVRPAASATAYVVGDVHLRTREDVYTHTTETRTKIQKSESSSSSSGGGGGGGGSFSRSGKF